MNKILVVLTVFVLLFFANISNANAGFFNWKIQSISTDQLVANMGTQWSFVKIANKSAEVGIVQAKPEKPEKNYEVIKTYPVRATAYSSTVDQTDSTPFVTASGTYVKDGIIAANFLPFGTQIRIPEIFGDKIFMVEDRMNKRYWHNVDIWFPERQLAKEFGVKNITIEVVTELSES